MTIDALAYERHFIDHCAPVWQALPASMRGRFLTDPDLVPYARALGIAALGIGPPRRIPPNPAPVHDGIPALVASYGDIKKGRRMGYGPFAFLEHGIGQSYAGDRRQARHPSYSGGMDRDDVGLFLVPNENAGQRWRDTYPGARVEVVGSPRLDDLPAREPGPGPVVALSFHFPTNVVPETTPALDHYIGVLPELAKRYKVIGHGHPRYYGIDRRWRRAGIEYVPDFADVCRRADVYVCDNSSTIFEFAATGRPVVVLNQPAYRKHIQHGLRFWEAADVGIQVDHARDLPAAIEEALADKPARRKARERALDIVYAHRSGAAKRASTALVEWASGRQAVDDAA